MHSIVQCACVSEPSPPLFSLTLTLPLDLFPCPSPCSQVRGEEGSVCAAVTDESESVASTVSEDYRYTEEYVHIGVGTMGASAPPNFDTWGLSPPKASDGCLKHTESDVSWHRVEFICCHFITGVFDPCLQEACLRVYQSRSPEVKNLFLGQYSSRPIK